MKRLERTSIFSSICFILIFSPWVMSPDVATAPGIKVGVIGPMNFMQGKGHWDGATLAAEEINAQGGFQVGPKKMKIELVKEVEVPEISVPELFDQRADKHANNTALIFYGNKISYKELKELINRFATALADLGEANGEQDSGRIRHDRNHRGKSQHPL